MINRRQFLKASATAGIGLLLTNSSPLYGAILCCGNTSPEKDLNPFLNGATLVDAHAHPSMFHLGNTKLYNDSSSTVKQLCEFGFEGSVFAAVGDYVARGMAKPFTSDFNLTALQLSNIGKYLNDIIIVDRFADLPTYLASGTKPGAIMAIEGGNAIEGNPDNLNYFYEHHYVRMLTLVHSAPNDHVHSLGDQMLGNRVHGGLSRLGYQVLERMIDLNMIIDVAHACTDTLFQVCNLAQDAGVPVIDSHTSLRRAYYDPSAWQTQRMRTIEEMEAIAGTGGLVCTWPLQCTTACSYDRDTVSDWAREIQYLVGILGQDHIAFGSDGGGGLKNKVGGYETIKQISDLAYDMADIGMSTSEIHAFVGENMKRIIKDVLI